MENLEKKEYEAVVKDASPKPAWVKNMCFAFLFGGFICTIGQLLFMFFNSNLKFDEKVSRILVSVSLIGLGAFLTAIKIFDDIAKIAGAGTLVPITGFANSIVAPAIEFKSEGFVMGMGTKMFIIAGPVLVFGISGSILYGIVIFVLKMF